MEIRRRAAAGSIPAGSTNGGKTEAHRAGSEFVRSHKRVYVVEQNRDAQMFSLLRMDLDNDLVAKLRSIARLDGLPIDARSVTEEIAAMEEK